MLSLKYNDLGTAQLGLRDNAKLIEWRDAKAAERAEVPNIIVYADEYTLPAAVRRSFEAGAALAANSPAQGHRDPVHQVLRES